MYAKSTRPSAKREVQKERSAKRADFLLSIHVYAKWNIELKICTIEQKVLSKSESVSFSLNWNQWPIFRLDNQWFFTETNEKSLIA